MAEDPTGFSERRREENRRTIRQLKIELGEVSRMVRMVKELLESEITERKRRERELEKTFEKVESATPGYSGWWWS